jgi:hypothetical protein
MIITALSFITLLENWYNYEVLPLIKQLFLAPNRFNEFMGLRPNVSSPAWIG